MWSETGLGRTGEAVAYLDNMSQMERNGDLIQDANEGRWIVDSLHRIVNRDAPQEIKTRAEGLIKAINERLMSQYPFGTRVPMSQEPIWRDLEAAGYMRTPEPLQRTEPPPQEEQKQEEPPKPHDDDEMAATAARLLERVADNTSEKFQNSQFLGLMRRLRDREVRVQEDKIVEVDKSQPPGPKSHSVAPQNSSSIRPDQPSTQIPPVDPTILSHAATDFETPTYSDAGLDQSFSQQEQQYAYPSSTTIISSPEPPLTDEISDQYRFYNINAAYHQHHHQHHPHQLFSSFTPNPQFSQ